MLPKRTFSVTGRKLPWPDDSVTFFEAFKHVSEQYWETVVLDPETYGYQIQPGSKWKKGLTNTELFTFEKEVGFSFPEPLKNFYRVMNGLDRPGIYIADNKIDYQPQFYSFPDDLDLLRNMINWIYDANSVNADGLLSSGISRIFPVYSHRFTLIDDPNHPVLSMHGDDIIYWADNISKLLSKDVFWHELTSGNYKKLTAVKFEIKFWLH